MAAVLASGEGAVLSHASAAVLWAFLLPMRGRIDVSVPTQNGRTGARGVRLHRCSSLSAPGLVTCRHGIPVTTPARTVADLSQVLEPRLARRARRQAELFGRLRLDPRSDRTRSDLESDFLDFCRRHAIPAPEVNVKIGTWTVDFVWRKERVAVEADDLAYHRGDVSFEDDHALELDLRLAGYEFRRITGAQLDASPAKVARTLRDALGLG
jgi:very-short-patch-repair endonuclease